MRRGWLFVFGAGMGVARPLLLFVLRGWTRGGDGGGSAEVGDKDARADLLLRGISHDCSRVRVGLSASRREDRQAMATEPNAVTEVMVEVRAPEASTDHRSELELASTSVFGTVRRRCQCHCCSLRQQHTCANKQQICTCRRRRRCVAVTDERPIHAAGLPGGGGRRREAAAADPTTATSTASGSDTDSCLTAIRRTTATPRTMCFIHRTRAAGQSRSCHQC